MEERISRFRKRLIAFVRSAISEAEEKFGEASREDDMFSVGAASGGPWGIAGERL